MNVLFTCISSIYLCFYKKLFGKQNLVKKKSFVDFSKVDLVRNNKFETKSTVIFNNKSILKYLTVRRNSNNFAISNSNEAKFIL